MSISSMHIAYLTMAVLVVVLIGLLLLRRYRSRHLNTVYFTDRWRDLQQYCKTRKTWPQAVIAADNLVDEALRRRLFKGKTMGERLVAAQHVLTANEAVWFGHKLRSKLPDQDVRKLKKQDILEALAGFRQALKDLGALQ
jgi:hypothetical protein